ncbi:MAG: hypothetical protein RBT72_03315 [Spirochaetia bacterium]|nr:hypothetical protein [Spirochaetia bacterium]
MKKEEKVYDYNRQKVRDSLLSGFKRTRGESTVADIAALTGLPLPQINAELPALVDEYGARLKVTEKGELLYSFPKGMKSRYKGFGPGAKRFLRTLGKAASEVSKFLFKTWILVMLGGYFIIFLALALFALLASVAVQFGGSGRSDSRSSSRGGGLGGLWLTTRLFDSLIRIWFYSELFKPPQERFGQARAKPQRRPLHKAVFSHVFGDGDPNVDWDEVEKKTVIAFLQTHKGIMSMAEFMAITGLEPQEAETAVNKYLLEFEGSPEVSPEGSIYFAFPGLLRRMGSTPEFIGSSVKLKRLHKFSSNSPKADRTFRLINGVNIVFGGYFLYHAFNLGAAFYVSTPKGLALRGGLPIVYSATGYLLQSLGSVNPVSIILWGLGVVPLAFSAFFFAIPILRSFKQKADNERIKTENLRRIVYRNILSDSAAVGSQPGGQIEEAKPSDPEAVDKISLRLAAWSKAEPVEGGYEFAELKRIQADMEKLRASVDLESFAPGKTVFDTES